MYCFKLYIIWQIVKDKKMQIICYGSYKRPTSHVYIAVANKHSAVEQASAMAAGIEEGDYGGYFSASEDNLNCHIKSLIQNVDEIKQRLEYEKQNNILKWARITPNGFAPIKIFSARNYSFDLKSAYNYTICARGKANVATDIILRFPPGTYGRIVSRSGLPRQFSVDVSNTIIDADHSDNTWVVMFNHSDVAFNIRKGDLIARVVCEKAAMPRLEEHKLSHLWPRRDTYI